MTGQKTSHLNGNVPQAAHRKIWELVRYWQRISPLDRLPSRADLDPVDIPRLLPNIRLLDVGESGSFRYRVRLIGTAYTKHLGYDLTGRWYESVCSNFRGSVVEHDLKSLCQIRQPIYRNGRTIVPYVSGVTDIERVHVPFASDGENVDLIASLTLFEPTADLDMAYWAAFSMTPKSGRGDLAFGFETPEMGNFAVLASEGPRFSGPLAL